MTLFSAPIAQADTATATQSRLYDTINIQFTEAYQSRSSELINKITKEVSQLEGTSYHEPVEASLLHLNQFITAYDKATAAVDRAEKTRTAADISLAETAVGALPSSEVAHKSTFTGRIQAVIKANEKAAQAAEAAKKAAAEAAKQEAAAAQAAKIASEKAAAQEAAAKANNTYGLKFTGYSSIDEARALRNMIEQGGNMNVNLSLNLNYIGGYGFAKSTWLALCNVTGTSPTDFSVAHQNLLADTLVRDYFGGDWGNVPKSGGW